MRELEDKVAIITGAGRGIGAAAAVLFAKHGARIVVADLDIDVAQETVELIRQNNGTAIAVLCDVTNTEHIQRLISESARQFGQIDILVNNAGFTWDGMTHKMSDEQWEAILNVHLTAPFRIIRAVVPYLRDQAKREIEQTGAALPRKIINVSSTTGTRGKVGQINYAASKAGIIGLTKTLAKEWGAFNIQVNAVAYGMIDTRLTQPKDGERYTERAGTRVDLGIPQEMRETAIKTIPMGRPGTAEEAAGVLYFFASPYSNYVSGQVIEVTGGL